MSGDMPPGDGLSPESLGDFDVAIAGAGMAGASLAYALAPRLRVVVLERESQPGYHTTGRSAALFSEVYGNDLVRALSRASRAFLESPGAGFAEHPLLTPRGTLFFAAAGQLAQLQALHAEIAPRAAALRWCAAAEVCARVPALRPEAAQAGLFEPDASDIDVHALHQGYLRGARARGASIVCNAEIESARYAAARWTLVTRAGRCSAALVVNAAGAWADTLAELAGAARLGLTPLRRTALVFEDAGHWDCRHWPLAVDIDEQMYFKPDAGRLLASPADETPSPPCDAQPDELDVAILLDRLERMTLLRPRRITGRWAGLRTFAADRSPVAGFDAHAPQFFWLAGQGGYGIQTAPALAQFSASQILGHGLPDQLAAQGVTVAGLSAQRFAAPAGAAN